MTTLCEYGCGDPAKHQLKNKKHCCGKNTSQCPAIKKKNKASLEKAYEEGRMGYDYNSLDEETKLRMSRKGQLTMSKEQVFVDNKEWSSECLRKYLHYYKLLEYKCSGPKCTVINDWCGEHLTLELDHINGKRNDNRIENLRWMCPNCHSQTSTFRGRNKNTGIKKVSDELLLTALKNSSNIRTALQSVGLAAKGGNYERAAKLNATLEKLVNSADLKI